MYVEHLLMTIYIGYSEGIAPVMSFNLGERNFDKLRRIYRCSLRIIAVSSIATFGLSVLFAAPLVGIFVEEGSPVYVLATYGFRIFAVGFLFSGFNVYASAMFTALNDGRTSAILSFCHTIVFLLGMLLILPRMLGMLGVWFSMPIAEFMAVIMSAVFFRRMVRVYHY